MNTQTFYAAIVASTPLNVAADGSHRGNRHGIFTDFVEQARKQLESLPPSLYSVRDVARMAGVQGWAVRVAAKKLAADDEGTYTVYSGGRGNPSRVEIRV